MGWGRKGWNLCVGAGEGLGAKGELDQLEGLEASG